MAYISRFIFVFFALVTYAAGNDYPWLNRADVKITSRTDTSVVIEFGLTKDAMEMDPEKIRMSVSYEVLGFPTQLFIIGKYHDKECSLRLSYCRLSGLVPGQAYSAEIWIDDLNGKRLGYADFAFHTMDAPIKEISSTDSLQLWMIIVAVVVFVNIMAIVTVIVMNFVWRRRKRRKSTPIDDTVTAGSSGNEKDPHVGTQHQSQNVATPMQIFSTYDVIPPSDPEEDAIHTYATDFDPYDKVIESINDNSSSKPLPGVQPVNTSKAEDCVEQGDVDSGLYIQMTDVNSPETTTEKPTETAQLGGGGDGDYLTPIDIDDDADCVVEAGYVKL